MQAFIAELKRRKVFRVAFAYAAAAWAVLQVADIMLPIFGLPEWSMRLMLYVMAGGFPVAMLLSWIFDLSSEGLVPSPEVQSASPSISTAHALQFVLICTLVLMVGYLYYERLYLQRGAVSWTDADPQAQSIAVLPFANMSSDPDNIYFSDGISEELLNVLAQVDGLRVAARTSSFHFRDSTEDVIGIGRLLGVATLLEGSVRKTGDTVRVTAQLIDTRNGYHLWSETYDGTLEDIFALQDQIAGAVVRAIRPMIMEEGGLPHGPPTTNFNAYNAYLKGRALLRRPWNDLILDDAVDYFTEAAELDPEYADAFAGICDAQLAQYSHSREAEAFSLAERACLRALAKSESGVPGWDVQIALGVLYREAGEHAKSLEYLSAADREYPDRPRTLQEIGRTYSVSGRNEEAEQYLKRAVALDENNWETRLVLANFYIDSSQYAKARAAYDEVLAKAPDLLSALIGQGSALYMLGLEEQAEQVWLQVVEQAGPDSAGSLGISYTNLGLLHYYQGDYAQAAAMHEAAASHIADDHRVWGRIAESYRALGDRDRERANYAQAISRAEQRLSRNPNDWETLGLLGLYHAYSGNRAEALSYTQRMLDTGTSPPTSHYFAALVHWALGKPEPAYVELAEARSLGFSADILLEDPDLIKLRALDTARFDAALGME